MRDCSCMSSAEMKSVRVQAALRIGNSDHGHGDLQTISIEALRRSQPIICSPGKQYIAYRCSQSGKEAGLSRLGAISVFGSRSERRPAHPRSLPESL